MVGTVTRWIVNTEKALVKLCRRWDEVLVREALKASQKCSVL